MRGYIFGMLLILFLLGGCVQEKKKFRRIPSTDSGITFKNVLKETVEFNIFNYMYFYNGGGVAVGDLNGDTLPDIYFTANQESNKLYLNKGDFKFQDVTEEAGVEGFNGWTTGVTFADVNGDGKLDMYVCYLGDYLIYKGKNQLFINEGNDENGIPKFTDRAIEFGLDLVGYSTQSAFLDYDKDGDLDMFLLTHSLHQHGTFAKAALRTASHPLAGDKLMRNDNGHFIDVTKDAGIYNSVLGYGLGVVTSDVNMDGWPDIYVGNDFHENDYLYINQKDGTFKEWLEHSMMHTSRYTMGVDFADFNNDAFPDLIGMDMLPADPVILKSSVAEDTYDVYNFKLGFGYHHQFARNVLQLNNQDGTFSDIALLAGVSATDWSWSALMADFDLDGQKDILVSNGIARRPNDLDYLNFIQLDTVQMQLTKITSKELAYVNKMPEVKLSNYLFRNNGDSTFTDEASAWGLGEPSYSNGAAYADLDRDGDLDIVMNNVNEEAFLYENQTVNPDHAEKRNHYFQISLKGKPGNTQGIGAKVFLYKGGSVQMQECVPTRGFQSSVDYLLTFGLGSADVIDSLVVVWNDDAFQQLKKVRADQMLVVHQTEGTPGFVYDFLHRRPEWFVNTTSDLNLPYRHKENNFVEFNREQLLPHMLSAEGPAVAVGDINGDGFDDLFVGGGKWQPGQIIIQNEAGKFSNTIQPSIKMDSTCEDVDAAFFDADGDADLDLFVVSGGNEFSGKSKHRLSRLYLNNGKGTFTKSSDIPDIFITGSCISPEDFDRDGDIDLFLGSRAIPWRYGLKPDAYLLLNDGNGKFTNATQKVAPMLAQFGFVKDAQWIDMNGDGYKDLVLAAEWSPITILLNNKGVFRPMTMEGSGLEMTQGWWNVIRSADFDNDGDQDLVAGNLGRNSKLRASPEKPVKMYVSDFDKNDSTDQVLTHFINDKQYPFHTRDEMVKQMPYLKKKYLSYRKFAEADVGDLFDTESLRQSEEYTANLFESVYIENVGNGQFVVKPLPAAAQFSNVQAILTGDFDSDGHLDIMLGGNFYYPNIQIGRYDASYGSILKGDGKGGFHPVPSYQSGFTVKGQVRRLVKFRQRDVLHYLAIRNNDSVAAFSAKR